MFSRVSRNSPKSRTGFPNPPDRSVNRRERRAARHPAEKTASTSNAVVSLTRRANLDLQGNGNHAGRSFYMGISAVHRRFQGLVAPGSNARSIRSVLPEKSPSARRSRACPAQSGSSVGASRAATGSVAAVPVSMATTAGCFSRVHDRQGLARPGPRRRASARPDDRPDHARGRFAYGDAVDWIHEPFLRCVSRSADSGQRSAASRRRAVARVDRSSFLRRSAGRFVPQSVMNQVTIPARR